MQVRRGESKGTDGTSGWLQKRMNDFDLTPTKRWAGFANLGNLCVFHLPKYLNTYTFFTRFLHYIRGQNAILAGQKSKKVIVIKKWQNTMLTCCYYPPLVPHINHANKYISSINIYNKIYKIFPRHHNHQRDAINITSVVWCLPPLWLGGNGSEVTQ